MTALSQQARDQIKESGLTIAAYVRDRWHDGAWHGDACGCSDDRCIGYHHDEGEECQCLPVLIRGVLASGGDALTRLVAYREARASLHGDIKAAAAGGVTQAEIARVSGLSRQWVALVLRA